MTELEKLEKRWSELAGRPKTEEEAKEILFLSKRLSSLRAKEHQKLTDELSEVGIEIGSVWDLVNTRARYPKAIPILLRHLKLDYSDKAKEGIIRSLTVIEAKGKATDVLIVEYKKTPFEKENFRWVIGNAICKTITDDSMEKVIEIVKDKKNGMSREMFILALGKTKKYREKAISTLMGLTHDGDVMPYAIEALTKLKAIEAKKRILELTDNPDKDIRKKVKKFLDKIG